MQTSPCYCDIIIPTDTKVRQQSCSMCSLARFVTYRRPDMVDRRKIHLILWLPEIFCPNLFFWWVYIGFFKNLIGSPGFGIYSLGSCYPFRTSFFVFTKFSMHNGSHMGGHMIYDIKVVHFLKCIFNFWPSATLIRHWLATLIKPQLSTPNEMVHRRSMSSCHMHITSAFPMYHSTGFVCVKKRVE